MRFLQCLTVIVVLSVAAGVLAEAPADQPAKDPPNASAASSVPVFVPAKTTVALLPIVDQTGKRDAELGKAKVKGTKLIEDLFSGRGFQLAKPTDVTDLLAKDKIDLMSEESRSKDKLSSIGKALGADLLVCCVLQYLDVRMKFVPFSSRKVGKSKVQVKLLDVNGGTFLVDGIFESKKQGNWLLPQASKTKSLGAEAIANSVAAALEDFLEHYKPLPKASQTPEGGSQQ